jgi:alkylhydroperoxidase family enzyme
LTTQQIDALARFEDSDSYSLLEKNVLRFAQEWTEKGKASAEVVEHLRQSLSPAELVSLAATVGLANWTNRFSATFQIALP